MDGGVLDRDTIDQEEPATENITFARAAAGLYKVYVNYYLSHTPSASDPVPTTVKIYVNDDEVFTETRTITEPEEGIDDGRGTWSVCTLVVHSGEESGGFQVAANGLRCSEKHWRTNTARTWSCLISKGDRITANGKAMAASNASRTGRFEPPTELRRRFQIAAP